jgi:hypothetical protein
MIDVHFSSYLLVREALEPEMAEAAGRAVEMVPLGTEETAVEQTVPSWMSRIRAMSRAGVECAGALRRMCVGSRICWC